jgi:hypothetical protein
VVDAANAHARLAALPAVPQEPRDCSSTDDEAASEAGDAAGDTASEISTILSKFGLLDADATSAPAAAR